jgi:hypothetical protein
MTNKFLTISTVALLSTLLLAGCGKEAGRVPFVAEGTQSATMPLTAGDVAFWTDIDIQYEGDAVLTYRVDLLQGGSTVATAECPALGPMSMKVGWVETQFGASRSRSGNGKMTCSAQLAKSGPTIVQSTLAFDVRPLSVTVTKADLVVKQ